MNTANRSSGFSLSTQHRYQDNFARHILAITLHLQSEIMNALTLRHGHSQLRINFEPYMAIAGDTGARLSDIAELLGISRQAANQAANQIEAAGYLVRSPDPADGRAKLLTPTPRGKAMRRQGAREAQQQQRRLAAVVDADELREATESLTRLESELGILLPQQTAGDTPLIAVLPRLSDYINARLMELTMARGHANLKLSFGPVLTAIGPRGGRIQQIANNQDVSKQAISATVSELVELGYIERRTDPDDARQVVVVLTDTGQHLISDSIAAVETLESEFSMLIGTAALEQIKRVMARIYRSLQLEGDVFGHTDGDQIEVIIRELTRKLGVEGTRELAKRILAGQAQIEQETST